MRQSEERYISLLTDFGFKRIFGTKPNRDLLINFQNSLFEGEQVIPDVRYLNSEHVGDVYAEAEIAKINPKELREYEDSLKAYRDIKNSLDTAKEQGKAEGIEIGKADEKRGIALRLLAMGLTFEQVAAGTQLPVEEVKELAKRQAD